ncbi:alpha/beta fold hydrolase [Streptomyces sp. NPDC047000]|uniref:alpha/beta fold hydrolase n=1 Tax=Streptomyces sp. NPDC047000 TaxID=3155474 RepID=UPI0033C874CB
MSETPGDVVVLHSLGLTGRAYAALDAELPHRRLHRPDLRGHGDAADVLPATLPGMADDIAALVRRLAAQAGRPVHLVGHSLGGAVAGLVAQRCADLLASVTVIASPATGLPVFRERARDAERHGMAPQVEATLRRWFASPEQGGPAVAAARAGLESLTVATWAAIWRSFADFPGWAALGLPDGFGERLLCLSFAEDRSTPPSALAQIAEACGGHHVAVGHGGHMAPLEEPALLAAHLESHWTRLAATGEEAHA